MTAACRRSFWIFTNTLFFSAFIAHMSFIVYYILHPSTPSVRHESIKLKDIEFPLDFSFCFPDFERNRFKNYGYLYDQRLFRGDSAFNRTIVGWNGHMENGSTIMSIGGKSQNQNTDY